MRAWHSHHQRNKRGLTLIEMVIVLGVLGVVFAGLWAAASAVRQKQNISDAANLTGEIANTAISIYTGHPGASPPTTVVAQIAAELFPEAIVNPARTATANPWGGQVLLDFDRRVVGGVNRLLGFAVEMDLPVTLDASLRRDVCMGMVSRLPGYQTGAGALAGGLPIPAGVLPINPNQGGGPALSIVRIGGAWQNVTDTPTLTAIVGGNADCAGVAFYYRF